MSVFLDVFGGPAPTIFQIFSNFFDLREFSEGFPGSQFADFQYFPEFRAFLRFRLFSQFAIFQTFPNLRGISQVSIGRYSPKFFGKRRKRRNDVALFYCSGFSRKIFAQIGFCEDTGVFVGIIVVIASQIPQIRTVIVCGHLPDPFGQSVADAFNFDLAKMPSSRSFTAVFNSGFWDSSSIRCRSFELFGFPPSPPQAFFLSDCSEIRFEGRVLNCFLAMFHSIF
jgi:hypothetical protein